MQLRDKVAIVTGGAHGIGAGLCRRFVAEDATAVIVVDLEEEAAQLFAEDIGAEAMVADVGCEEQIAHVVAAVEKRHGRIDLFCSNAGVGFTDGPGAMAVSASNDLWETSWQVNVMAHVYAARAVLPGMISRGSGYLLNTVSAAGLLSQIGSATYSTTKHAAIGLAESLAITHADQGIGVSVLCPQGVDTRMLTASEVSGVGPQSADGVLSVETVADAVIAGLADESFLILPHPGVLDYMRHKTADYDRWLGGMRKLRRRYLA